MTNAIGTGTTNLSVNAPVDWRAELGRAASGAGVSMGEFMRRIIERGAQGECPKLAARLRAVREQYYGAALLVLFMGITVNSWFDEDDTEIRRARGQQVRVVRSVRRSREEVV